MKYLLLVLMVLPLACDTLGKTTAIRIDTIEEKLREIDVDQDGMISLVDLLIILGGGGVIAGGGTVLAKKVKQSPPKKKT
jgi:Ca2+-binding EF-hand superfamily protein